MTVLTRETHSTAVETLTWTPVVEEHRLERDVGVAALLKGRHIALYRTWNDRLYASSNVDPDNGASVLSRGIVGESGGVPTIASPLLKAVFNLETGECLTNDELSVETYPVRVVDGIIQVGLDF